MDNRKIINVLIGDNMLKLRNMVGITQKQISVYLGLNESTYKHYELGDRATPISILKDLSDFYNLSIDYFFEDNPKLSKNDIKKLSEFKLDDKKIIKNNSNEDKIQLSIRLKIKKLRFDNKKTQQDVSNLLGVDLSTYNKYENGNRKINNETIKKLGKYYNLTITELTY